MSLKLRPHVYITIYNALSLMLSSFKGKSENRKRKPTWLFSPLPCSFLYPILLFSQHPNCSLSQSPFWHPHCWVQLKEMGIFFLNKQSLSVTVICWWKCLSGGHKIKYEVYYLSPTNGTLAVFPDPKRRSLTNTMLVLWKEGKFTKALFSLGNKRVQGPIERWRRRW